MKIFFAFSFFIAAIQSTVAQTWTTYNYQSTHENWMLGIADICGTNSENLFLQDKYTNLYSQRNGIIDSLPYPGIVSNPQCSEDTAVFFISNKQILRYKNLILDTIRGLDTLPSALNNYPFLLTTHNNEIWSAKRVLGILKIDMTTQQEIQIDSIDNRPILYSSLIFNDDVGNTYGVCQNGVYKYDGVNGSWLDTLNIIHANSAVVRNDTIWVAAYTGLYAYAQDSLIAKYTRFNSDLAMNYCSDLAWHNDILYISHHKFGISFVSMESGYSSFDGTNFTRHPTIQNKVDYSICFEEVGGTLFMGSRFGPMLEYSDSQNDWIKEHGFNLNSEETRIQVLKNNAMAVIDDNSVSIYNMNDNTWTENDYKDQLGSSVLSPLKYGSAAILATKNLYGPTVLVSLDDGQMKTWLNDFKSLYYHENTDRVWGIHTANFGYFSFTSNQFTAIANLGDVRNMYFDEMTNNIWLVSFQNSIANLYRLDVNGNIEESWVLSLENDFYNEYSICDIVVTNSNKVWITVNELYSYQAKLVIFDAVSETEKEMNHYFGDLYLPDFHVHKMEKDCDNRVWFTFNQISANKGIVIADTQDDFFQVTTDNSELFDDKVYDLNYANQTMWVGVENALQKVDFSSGCNSITMDIKKKNVLDFELFPNPNNGDFSITASESSSLEIHSISGRLVYSQLLREGTNYIKIENAKGIYLATFVLDKGGKVIKKFLIN